ncbi:MAG: hypothetical protein R3304_07010 [Longimicrobiales bacterium]|nr:hypothetical protein [Longimicrobiales bacterium]
MDRSVNRRSIGPARPRRVAALGLTRLTADLLVGVPATDPVTYAAVGLLLCSVAVGASWAPAWRAAGGDPRQALSSQWSGGHRMLPILAPR